MYNRQIDLYVYAESRELNPQDVKYYQLVQDESDKSGHSFQFVAIDPMGMVSSPSLPMSIQTAQNLMDELWNTGLRPTEGSGSAGAMAAQGKHLEDMRAIVFGTKSYYADLKGLPIKTLDERK